MDTGEREEQLGGKGPAGRILDVSLEEGVGFVEVRVEEGETEFLREELASRGFAASNRADERDLFEAHIILIRIIIFITVISCFCSSSDL